MAMLNSQRVVVACLTPRWRRKKKKKRRRQGERSQIHKLFKPSSLRVSASNASIPTGMTLGWPRKMGESTLVGKIEGLGIHGLRQHAWPYIYIHIYIYTACVCVCMLYECNSIVFSVCVGMYRQIDVKSHAFSHVVPHLPWALSLNFIHR